jgi:uncharacterized membrane protein YidH (DUF202 family)
MISDNTLKSVLSSMVLLIQQLGRWRDYPREKVMDVKSLRTPISNVLAAIGAVFVVVSIYCLWNAHKIRQQQLQLAGDDPFAMVFSDKIQREDTGTGNDEMTKLNNQRLRSENRGWYLIIGGVGLLVAGSALKGWRRKPLTLGLGEDRQEG